MGQRFGQPQALRVPQRQGARTSLGISAQTQPLDDLFHSFQLGAGSQTAHGFQVLTDGELWVGIGCLNQVTDGIPRLYFSEVDALPQDIGFTGCGLDYPEQQADRGSLTCTVEPRKA
jgi:hypothetical protein